MRKIRAVRRLELREEGFIAAYCSTMMPNYNLSAEWALLLHWAFIRQLRSFDCFRDQMT